MDDSRPRVLIVDDNGRLADSGSDAAVILISTHAEADFADLIAQTPAVGFVAKSELSAAAIRRVASEPRGR
jgi:hypothetical protein